MVLPIVKYGHPVLRKKGARIDKITPQVSKLAANMIETMHDAHGVGLAAQQVGHAVQLMVIDVREATDRPSTLHINNEPADVDAFMPLALINPQVEPVAPKVEGPEGCLSFPEVYADISRPAEVEVIALNEHGQKLEFKCGGLLARVIQHELDHLHGILFIDRMTNEVKQPLKPQLQTLQAETKAELASK